MQRIPRPRSHDGPTVDARRLARPGWRHPRALGGIALVATAAVLGAWAVSSAARTTTVWTVAEPVRAGQPVAAAAFEPVEVRMPTSSLDGYVAGEEPPAPDGPGLVWAHDLPAGAVVPSSAMLTAEESASLEVPLAVAGGALPEDLASGDRVDVWVSPPQGQAGDARTVLVGVPVAEVGAVDAFSADGQRHVLVRVPVGSDQVLARALGALDDGTVTLVRARGAS